MQFSESVSDIGRKASYPDFMRAPKSNSTELQRRLRTAYPDGRCALDHQDPFQLVVATILSAQCTDARVNLTTPALFARFPDAASLAAAPLEALEALIKSTGFFHNKARNLIGLGQALMARYEGVVPNDLASLTALPGVGQKTANVVLSNAFGVPALPVDTHIFRVAKRLGLSKATTPEKVEADLCRLFPRDEWIDLHHQLIFHGRRTCDARRPDCQGCPLLDLCPTGQGRIKDPHSGTKFAAPPSGRHLTHDPRPTSHSPQPIKPLRIISLVPSVTELLVQWGLAAQLAGRSRYCIEPRWIRNTVPEVGGTKDPNMERIRALVQVLQKMRETPTEDYADGSSILKQDADCNAQPTAIRCMRSNNRNRSCTSGGWRAERRHPPIVPLDSYPNGRDVPASGPFFHPFAEAEG